MAEPTTALRELFQGRGSGHDRRVRDFTEADWRRYADLLGGVFLLAVRRRFRAGQDRAPVIRFVAGVRERYDRSGDEIDPMLAEALVWAALGDREPVPVSAAAVTAQTLLAIGLLADEGMPPAELDALLAAAERVVRDAPSPPAPEAGQVTPVG